MASDTWTSIEVTPGKLEITNGRVTVTLFADGLNVLVEGEDGPEYATNIPARDLLDAARLLEAAVEERYGKGL